MERTCHLHIEQHYVGALHKLFYDRRSVWCFFFMFRIEHDFSVLLTGAGAYMFSAIVQVFALF